MHQNACKNLSSAQLQSRAVSQADWTVRNQSWTHWQGVVEENTAADRTLNFQSSVVLADRRSTLPEQISGADVHPAMGPIKLDGYIATTAFLAAALYMDAQDPDAVLLVAPSDHLLPDTAAGQPDGLGQIFDLFRSAEATLL